MWCFWSAKGGVGTTVVAAAVALASAHSRSTLLVDLAGDVELLFGRAPARTGLGQWLEAENPPPDALSRLEIDLAPNLSLLPWGEDSGDGRLEEAAGRTDDGGNESAPPVTEAVAGLVAGPGTKDRVALLARLVDVEDRMVVVDLGTRSSAPTPSATTAGELLLFASRSTLVTRACYLAIRAAQPWPRPDEVVVVARQGRALRSADVSAAIGAPVVCEVRWDPAVARVVDAGLFGSRTPRSLRSLGRLAEVAGR